MAKNSDSLASNFVTELLAIALNKRTIFDMVRQHMKYSYFQVESEKKLWQWVTARTDRTGRIPTIGQMQQQFAEDEAVLEKIEEIIKKNKVIKGYKDIKGRKSGQYKDIELTILFNPDMKLCCCHNICDQIENEIKASLGNVTIVTHAEPEVLV